HRRVGAAAVRAEAAEFLAQRARPEGFARLAVETLKIVADAHRIDIARRRITRDARPADPLLGHIGEVDVELVLPDDLARRGIGADHFFAFAGGARLARGQRVELAVHHDRRRAGGQLRPLPEQVLAVGVPTVDQAGLAGNAVLFWTSPGGPIVPFGLGAP